MIHDPDDLRVRLDGLLDGSHGHRASRATERHPAEHTAVPQTYSPARLRLALSLACYVSDDDTELTRGEFLELVAGRINHDLLTGEY